jgi:hypothetical protein
MLTRIALCAMFAVAGACSNAQPASPDRTTIATVATTTTTAAPAPECAMSRDQLRQLQARAGSVGLAALTAELERQNAALATC